MVRGTAPRLALMLVLSVLSACASSATPNPGDPAALDDTLAARVLSAEHDSAAVRAASPADTAAPDSAVVPSLADRVVVYYFHRTARCDNCLKFEAYTDSLLNTAFQRALSKGTLEWHVLNLDNDGNEVFIGRYALEEITLLSSLVIGGEEQSWRPLDAIWWLVDDRQAFADYVATEVRDDLRVVHGRQAPAAALGEGVGGADRKKEGDCHEDARGILPGVCGEAGRAGRSLRRQAND